MVCKIIELLFNIEFSIFIPLTIPICFFLSPCFFPKSTTNLPSFIAKIPSKGWQFNSNKKLLILFDKELLTSIFKINSSNFSVIHGEGINNSEFRNIQRDTSIPKFLLASRLIQSKGIECYITAAKRIKAKYPHVEFSLAGIFNLDNPESISLQLFEEIKTDADIKFLGEVSHSNMEECFHKNNIFVLPSEREGLPKVVTEAATTGMPLILSNVPGCKDCVINNKSGKLVNYMDENELYDAMKSFADDTDLITLMGKESAKFAREKFSIETITKQYLEIIS